VVLSEAVRFRQGVENAGLTVRIARTVGGQVTYTGLPSTLNITLVYSNGAQLAPSDSKLDPDVRTIVEVSLPSDAIGLDRTQYYVLFDANMLEDYSGNAFLGFQSASAWSFSTTDVLPPTIKRSSPLFNATDVSVRMTELSLTMSEEVLPMTGGRVSVYARDATARRLAQSDFIEDGSSYAIASDMSLLNSDIGSFAQANAPPTNMSGASVAAGRGAGEDGWRLVERFAIDDSTRAIVDGTTVSLRLRAGTLASYSQEYLVNITAGPRMILAADIPELDWGNTDVPYANATNGSVPVYDVAGGLADLSGKSLQGYEWRFVTVPDLVAPQVLKAVPSMSQSPVALGPNGEPPAIAIVLSEPVNAVAGPNRTMESVFADLNVTVTNLDTGASAMASLGNASQATMDTVMVSLSSTGAAMAPTDSDASDPEYMSPSRSFEGSIAATRILVKDLPGFKDNVGQSSGQYEVVFNPNGAIVDQSSNANALGRIRWRFTSADTVAPVIERAVPADGTRDVTAGTTTIRVLMSEAVQRGQGSVELVSPDSGISIAVLDAASSS